jgi:hypothetical protein
MLAFLFASARDAIYAMQNKKSSCFSSETHLGLPKSSAIRAML